MLLKRGSYSSFSWLPCNRTPFLCVKSSVFMGFDGKQSYFSLEKLKIPDIHTTKSPPIRCPQLT